MDIKWSPKELEYLEENRGLIESAGRETIVDIIKSMKVGLLSALQIQRIQVALGYLVCPDEFIVDYDPKAFVSHIRYPERFKKSKRGSILWDKYYLVVKPEEEVVKGFWLNYLKDQDWTEVPILKAIIPLAKFILL